MRADAAQPAAVKPGDQLRRGGGGHPVGHDQPGTPIRVRGDRRRDPVLGGGVQAGRGVVQDQQPLRVQGPGQPESLRLAPGHRGGVEPAVVAVRQPLDELVDRGRPGHRAESRLGVGGVAEHDRLRDRLADQHRPLEAVADRLPQGGAAQPAQRYPVQQHLAGVGVPQPAGDRGQGRLARSGGTDDGDRGAGRYPQVDPVQHRPAVVGVHGHPGQDQPAGAVGQRCRPVPPGRFGQYGGDPLRPGPGPDQPVEGGDDAAEPGAERGVLHGGEELARGESPLRHRPAADRDDRQLQQRGQRCRPARGPGQRGPGAGTVRAQQRQRLQYPVDLGPDGAGGGDGAGAVQRLGEPPGDPPLYPEIAGGGGGGVGDEGAQAGGEQQQPGAERGGEAPVEQQQRDDAAQRGSAAATPNTTVLPAWPESAACPTSRPTRSPTG
ncbi:hypothetical protein GCM10027615_56430 [Plantactinospora veratri]